MPLLDRKTSSSPIPTDFAARVAALRGESYPAPVWVALEYRYMPPIARPFMDEVHQARPVASTMLTIREHRYPFLEKVGQLEPVQSLPPGVRWSRKCCHFFDLMRLTLKLGTGAGDGFGADRT